MKEEKETKFQNPYSCNKCGELENQVVIGNLREDGASTKCKSCGFEDFWAFGFFESSQDIESKAKNYTRTTCPI